jgi:hypothetical protein
MRPVRTRLDSTEGEVLVRLLGGPADGTLLVSAPLDLPLDLYAIGTAPEPVITIGVREGPNGLIPGPPTPAGAVRYLRRLTADREPVYVAEDLNVP